MSNEHLFNVQK